VSSTEIGDHRSISCFCKAGAYQKGDQRILAESTFVEQVLSEATGKFSENTGLPLKDLALRVLEHALRNCFLWALKRFWIRPGIIEVFRPAAYYATGRQKSWVSVKTS